MKLALRAAQRVVIRASPVHHDLPYKFIDTAFRVYSSAFPFASNSRFVEISSDDIRDAMRHAEWNYRMAKDPKVGPGWASFFSTSYEVVNGLMEPWEENVMDYNNDQEGIRAATEGRPFAPKNLTILKK